MSYQGQSWCARSVSVQMPLHFPIVKRACDRCRLHKVKVKLPLPLPCINSTNITQCDGKKPCRECISRRRTCEFLNPVRKRGPRSRKRIEQRSAAFKAHDHDSLDWSIGNLPNTEAAISTKQSSPSWASLDSMEIEFEGEVQDSKSLTQTLEQSTVSRSASPGFKGSPTGIQSVNHGALPDDLSTGLVFSNSGTRRDLRTSIEQNPPAALRLTIPQLPYLSHKSKLAIVSMDTLIIPRLRTYYQRIYSMMPVLPPQATLGLLSSHANPSSVVKSHMDNSDFLALVLSVAALACVHPLEANEGRGWAERKEQAIALLDEAQRLLAMRSWKFTPSVASILTSYVMFGTMLELGYKEPASLKLREATVYAESMGLDHARTYTSLTNEEARRRLNMFWVITITERAFALFNQGSSIVFTSSIVSDYARGDVYVKNPGAPLNTLGSQHMRYLAVLFSHIDDNLINCWTNRCKTLAAGCSLARDDIGRILRSLDQPTESLFPRLDKLDESQRTDLLVTWQWIRNRIWMLALQHGYIHIVSVMKSLSSTPNYAYELGPHYPVAIAEQTMAFCSTFTIASMNSHGAGFAEKLFDIASCVADMLKMMGLFQVAGKDLIGGPDTSKWTEVLQELYMQIKEHRNGSRFAAMLEGEITKIHAEEYS